MTCCIGPKDDEFADVNLGGEGSCIEGECTGGSGSGGRSASGGIDASGGTSSGGRTAAGGASTGGTGGALTGNGRFLRGACFPICSPDVEDPQGDGWATENGASCVVADSAPYRRGTPCEIEGSGGTGTGGSPTGGVHTGGLATGGVTTGGFAATGGQTLTGGTGGTGGVSTGGVPTTGGASTGGEPTGKFLGNITTGNAVDTDGKTYSKYWDQITPENAGKWGEVQRDVNAAPNWTVLDNVYKYAEANHIIFKQHTFVWGNQQPGGSVNEAAVKKWMTDFCTRYPNTKLIDVVNEPPGHTEPHYSGSIGGGTGSSWQWIINAFKWADEACPNAVLILNDFNNIEWPNDQANFLKIVAALKKANAPIDAIGAQAHDLDHGSITFDSVKTMLTKLHEESGLPIYITEMDISTDNDSNQLKMYQQYFPLFWEADYVPGITVWGWIYGKTWNMAPQSGLIRNGTFRPAMTYLMEQVGRPTN